MQPLSWAPAITETARNTSAIKFVKSLLKMNSDRTLTGARASEVIRHPSAIAEPSCKNLLLVDAQTILELRQDLVDEVGVAIVGVGPTIVEPVGGYENCTFPGQVAKAVVAWSDVVHVAIEPVKAEDELVWLVRVVVSGDLKDVLSIAYAFGTARQRGLAAPGGGCGHAVE